MCKSLKQKRLKICDENSFYVSILFYWNSLIQVLLLSYLFWCIRNVLHSFLYAVTSCIIYGHIPYTKNITQPNIIGNA